MVTWLVPGETGTNQPCGSPATMSCSRLTPASQIDDAGVRVEAEDAVQPGMEMTRPPSFCAALL